MKDVQDYLEKGMYGGPQIKPDEKRRYLGNFLERCYLYVENKDQKADNLWEQLENTLQKNEGTLYIHQQIPTTIQDRCIQLAQKYQRPFTMVNGLPLADDTVILVYAAKEAVHVENPCFQAKEQQEQTATAKEHSSFWQRLFHKK